MNSKTIKTLLFASLIAAMILPFSGMMMADAEKVNNTETNSNNFVPQPETPEDLEEARIREQALNDLGIQTIGVGNQIDTTDEPFPMKRSGAGHLTTQDEVTTQSRPSTDNWYGSNLNKLTSSINGVYAKSEVHDNGYTLADGTTLYAPTMMGPGNSPLEIVTAYYNPSGSTYDTLDKVFVYDHTTDDWEYTVVIDSTFLDKYTSGSNYYFGEIIDDNGTWKAKLYNFNTASWETLYSQSSDGSNDNGWYLWEEDAFSSGCPTADPEIEGDLLKVNYDGNWVLATDIYSSTYDTGLPCSFSGTWDNNYYNWRVND